MLDATCDCETCTEVATPVHRRTPRGSWPLSPAVVLLVGATDAIRGTRPEKVVQVIRDSMALYAERLVICSVPEGIEKVLGDATKGARREKKENDTATTGHGSPGGLTPTALDVCGQGSEGHPARPQAQHPVLLRHPQPGTTKHPQEPTDPQKKQSIGPVSPVGLLFPETRSNDVIPQAVQPQQSPPWQGNIQPPYLTQPMGALPIGLDLARMIADMVQHYMRQQHPQ
ncbi:hypothetical protein MRX96_032891 [Rhipicephalus microplus]